VQNVERTFAVSYDRLNPSNAIDGAALKVLARAAFFAPGEPIPRDLLRATIGAPEDDQLEVLVVKAFHRLGTLGLLDKQLGESYRMHRLLAMFVRERSASSDKEAQRDVEQALLERAQQLNEAGYPAPLLALQPHVREVTKTAIQSESELAASLCNVLGTHLLDVGDYSEAQFYLQQALDIWQKALGPEHPDVALFLENYAALLHQLNRTEEAVKLEEHAQKIRAKQTKSM
jgi:tetratricopeptide (TPR) repeat protein